MSIDHIKPKPVRIRVYGLLYTWLNSRKEKNTQLSLHLSEQAALVAMKVIIRSQTGGATVVKRNKNSDLLTLADAWEEYTDHAETFAFYRCALDVE